MTSLAVNFMFVVEAAEDICWFPNYSDMRICCRATLSGHTQTTYLNSAPRLCLFTLSFHVVMNTQSSRFFKLPHSEDDKGVSGTQQYVDRAEKRRRLHTMVVAWGTNYRGGCKGKGARVHTNGRLKRCNDARAVLEGVLNWQQQVRTH
jgi:hypothetical protein